MKLTNRHLGMHTVCAMLLLFLASFFIAGNTAQAAQKNEIAMLQQGKTNSSYDITGDGKNDTISYTVKTEVRNQYEQYGKFTLYLNDTQIYQQSRPESSWQVQLVMMGDGTALISIMSTIYSDDGEEHKLYRYENGKLKQLYNFQKDYEKYASYFSVCIDSVKGNTISAVAHAQFFATGAVSFPMKFTYKAGKVKRNASTHSILYDKKSGKKWTVAKKLKVYAKANSKKAKRTLKKGDKIKIDKVVLSGKKICFRIRDKKGKKGYIRCPKTYPKTLYFKEAVFAG